jgi:hypothetical protein
VFVAGGGNVVNTQTGQMRPLAASRVPQTSVPGYCPTRAQCSPPGRAIRTLCLNCITSTRPHPSQPPPRFHVSPDHRFPGPALSATASMADFFRGLKSKLTDTVSLRGGAEPEGGNRSAPPAPTDVKRCVQPLCSCAAPPAATLYSDDSPCRSSTTRTSAAAAVSVNPRNPYAHARQLPSREDADPRITSTLLLLLLLLHIDQGYVGPVRPV